MFKKLALTLAICAAGVPAAAAVILPTADGYKLEAPGVGTFVVTGCGEGLVLRLYTAPDAYEGIDGAPDVYDVECDLRILSWDEEARELFYWKSDDGGYSIWAWRPGGGAPALVARSWAQPDLTVEGIAGGVRPEAVRPLPSGDDGP